MTTKKRLCSIKGITEAKVDKIKVQNYRREQHKNLTLAFLIVGSNN